MIKDNVAKSLVSKIDSPITEITILAALAEAMRTAPQEARFGYDLDMIQEFVLRRIMKLGRECEDAVCKMREGSAA